MNSTDKKIAIGGIILIVILAITACVLLTGGKKDSPIKIVSEVETVELNDIDNKSVGSNSSFENDTIVPVVPKENIKGEKESTSALKKDNIITGKYESHSLREIKNNDSQMQELFGYWDDILDVEGTFEELGKPIGSDEENDKETYVTLFGMDKAKKDVMEYSNNAISIIKSFESHNEFLESLVESLVSRRK